MITLWKMVYFEKKNTFKIIHLFLLTHLSHTWYQKNKPTSKRKWIKKKTPNIFGVLRTFRFFYFHFLVTAVHLCNFANDGGLISMSEFTLNLNHLGLKLRENIQRSPHKIKMVKMTIREWQPDATTPINFHFCLLSCFFILFLICSARLLSKISGTWTSTRFTHNFFSGSLFNR